MSTSARRRAGTTPGKNADPQRGSTLLVRALGGLSLVLLAGAVAWPVLRRHLPPNEPGADGTIAGAPASQQPRPSQNTSDEAVRRLQEASQALREAAEKALTQASASKPVPGSAVTTEPSPRPAAPDAPGARASSSATACMQRIVPEKTFGTKPLDWVCEQNNVWSIQLDLYSRVTTYGRGDGVAFWVQLGHFELPAIAILRARCCPGAAPLEAAVPTERCGSLSEVLNGVVTDASPPRIDAYADTIDCLRQRQVHLPEAWKRVPASQARRRFDGFVEATRPEPEK